MTYEFHYKYINSRIFYRNLGYASKESSKHIFFFFFISNFLTKNFRIVKKCTHELFERINKIINTWFLYIVCKIPLAIFCL